MKKRILLVGAVVLVGAALLVPAAARSAIGTNQNFGGSVDVSTINVNCGAGQSTGAALTPSINVSATLGGSGGNTGGGGGDRRIVVTWSQGQAAATLTDYGSATIDAVAPFPCPTTDTSDTSGTVKFQPQRQPGSSGSWQNVGTPAQVTITYHRVGSAS